MLHMAACPSTTKLDGLDFVINFEGQDMTTTWMKSVGLFSVEYRETHQE